MTTEIVSAKYELGPHSHILESTALLLDQNKHEGSEQLNFWVPTYCLADESCVCQYFGHFNRVGSFFIPEK